jgi:hypothetical protein
MAPMVSKVILSSILPSALGDLYFARNLAAVPMALVEAISKS